MPAPSTPSLLRETLNERLNAAVVACASLLDLRADRWGDEAVVEELNESRALDPSGVTTFLLLRGLLQRHARAESFTVADLLKDGGGFKARVARFEAVRVLVHDAEVEAELVAVQDRLRTMASRLAVPATTDFEGFLADSDLLGRVHRDAKRSLRDLRAVQFVQGAPATEPLQVNPQIFEFWNINSLLAALEAQRVDGATLCLIRDPEEVMASYFVFALRHGGSITVVSDYEPGPHPLHYQMSRNPGRTLEGRANRHWFPYDLLDLARAGGGRLFAKERKALVPYQHHLAPIGTLGALEPPNLTWAYLVLDGLIATYGRAHRQLPDLAYTAEMIAHPQLLSAARPDAVVTTTAEPYKPLALSALTHETVTRAAIAPQLGESSVGHNEWLVERFAAQVPDGLLAPIGLRDAAQLATRHRRLLERPRTRARWADEARTVAIEAISPTMFGSSEDIARDRLWLARLNQARTVAALAATEFQRERAGVERWCLERLWTQLPVLVDVAARGEWRLPSITPARDRPRPSGRIGFARGEVRGEENVVDQVLATTRREVPSTCGAFVLGVADEAGRTYWRCPVTQQRASVFTTFRPTCGQALAALFGVPFDALPVWLQHWTPRAPYVGNPILDRLDPADWAITNPWAELSMRVVLPLSRTAFKAARARLGLTGDHVLLHSDRSPSSS